MKNAEKMHIKMLYVKLSRIGARNGCVRRKVTISSSGGCCVLDEEAPLAAAVRFPSTEPSSFWRISCVPVAHSTS